METGSLAEFSWESPTGQSADVAAAAAIALKQKWGGWKRTSFAELIFFGTLVKVLSLNVRYMEGVQAVALSVKIGCFLVPLDHNRGGLALCCYVSVSAAQRPLRALLFRGFYHKLRPAILQTTAKSLALFRPPPHFTAFLLRFRTTKQNNTSPLLTLSRGRTWPLFSR